MSIYDDLKQVAGEVISEFKQGNIKYISNGVGVGPIDDPGAGIRKATSFDGVARGVSFKYVQQGFAVVSDLQVTLPASTGIVPVMQDGIEIDGINYKIVKILKKPAAGVTVVYVLIVRK